MTDKVIERIKNFESVIATLEAKVEELEASKSRSWKTSGKLNGSNIRIFDISKLVNTFASIVAAKSAFDKAKEVLEDDSDSEFIYEGHPYEHWLSDFKYAIDRQKIKSYNAKITYLKSMINAYTPEELRRDKAFDQMDAEMQQLLKVLK